MATFFFPQCVQMEKEKRSRVLLVLQKVENTLVCYSPCCFFLLILFLEDDKHNHTIPVFHREIFLLFKGVNESNKKVLVTN